ncbi:hypothetical protein PGB90_001173 [Kerria lacca]
MLTEEAKTTQQWSSSQSLDLLTNDPLGRFTCRRTKWYIVDYVVQDIFKNLSDCVVKLTTVSPVPVENFFVFYVSGFYFIFIFIFIFFFCLPHFTVVQCFLSSVKVLVATRDCGALIT